jgi:hypothetical protein
LRIWGKDADQVQANSICDLETQQQCPRLSRKRLSREYELALSRAFRPKRKKRIQNHSGEPASARKGVHGVIIQLKKKALDFIDRIQQIYLIDIYPDKIGRYLDLSR